MCNFNFPIGDVSKNDPVYPNKEPIIGDQHGNIQNALQEFEDIDLKDYFKFTFVRNPWERHFSYFKYMCSRNSQLTIENFKKLIYEMRDYKPKGFSPLEPQSNWFLHKGEMIVDFIGTTENMNQDLELISKKLNLNLKIPNKKLNKSISSPNKKHFYTKELIDIVADLEKDVIELKNYTF